MNLIRMLFILLIYIVIMFTLCTFAFQPLANVLASKELYNKVITEILQE
jgi:hypothetical protein